MRTIWFDMDGTLNDFYSVPNWLESLQAGDVAPYVQAAVLHNMSLLARYLNKVQELGYHIGVISWLARNSSQEYDEAVTAAKLDWLSCHLRSVSWDAIHIVSYGTPKESFMTSSTDILFDDEPRNRANWNGEAHTPDEIISILKELAA